MVLRPSLVCLIALSAILVSTAGESALLEPVSAQSFQPPACRLTVATGRHLCDPFLSFWDANEGLRLFGHPLTGQYDVEDDSSRRRITVQYFERQRMEMTAGGKSVQLGRVGVEALESRGQNWTLFSPADPNRDFYFPETRHAVDPVFQEFWSSYGLNLGDPGTSRRESIALFGYPISELMIETNSSFDQVVVQWYERARLEFHPKNPPGARIQLGRLGAELDPSEPPPTGRLELVAEGFTSPIALVPAPDDSGRLFVVDQVGLVHAIAADGETPSTAFLDLRDRMVTINTGYDERGLLGFAFHPHYPANGLVYVHYSAPLQAGAPPDWDHTARISEFQASAGPTGQVDPTTERVLLEIDQPHWAHNGGTIAFGPDGYLYIGLGDGGHGGDDGLGHAEDWYSVNRGGNGQDIESNLLGSILRIDINSEHGFAVPADNPLVDAPGLDEIWAFGFRNPFRFSFDSGGSHELFVADVGQDRWEEVNVVSAGGNYGWNVMEGNHCFYNVDPPPGPCPGFDPAGNPLQPPIIEFSNTGGPHGGLGRAIVGGYVYRGARDLALYGSYLFGAWSQDWSTPSGRLLVARRPPGGSGQWDIQSFQLDGYQDGVLDSYLLGFGQDHDGELYVLTTERLGPSDTTGRVYRISS